MVEPTTKESRTQAVYTTLNHIPVGKVTSYGKLASYAGLPGYGRYVGKLLRELPADTSLPWHRVIRSSGQIAFPPGSESFTRQKTRLEKEGVSVINGRIAIKDFQWTP